MPLKIIKIRPTSDVAGNNINTIIFQLRYPYEFMNEYHLNFLKYTPHVRLSLDIFHQICISKFLSRLFIYFLYIYGAIFSTHYNYSSISPYGEVVNPLIILYIKKCAYLKKNLQRHTQCSNTIHLAKWFMCWFSRKLLHALLKISWFVVNGEFRKDEFRILAPQEAIKIVRKHFRTCGWYTDSMSAEKSCGVLDNINVDD